MNRAAIDYACAVQRWVKPARTAARCAVCVACWVLIGFLLTRAV